MPDDPREVLAAQQRALVDALAGRDVPSAFDADQIATAGHSLLMKRMRSVQKAWPALADAVNDTDGAFFREYARLHAIPPTGPLDDARSFLNFVNEQGDDDLKLALCALRATWGRPIRWVCTPGGCAISLRLWKIGVRTWSRRRPRGPRV